MSIARSLPFALALTLAAAPVGRALACDGEDAPNKPAAAEKAPPANAVTVAYTVDGMSCAGCSGKVEAAVKKLKGVYTVAVDLNTKTAKVAYDPKKVSPEQIKKAIEKTGFKPAAVA